MLEKDLQRTVIEYLGYARIPFIRNNSFSGSIVRANGSTGFIKNNSYPGSPDLILFLHDGITYHIELKGENGKQSPEQIEYQRVIESIGHRYYIIRDLNELEKLLK